MQLMMANLQKSMNETVAKSITEATQGTTRQIEALKHTVESRLSSTELKMEKVGEKVEKTNQRVERLVQDAAKEKLELPDLVRRIIREEANNSTTRRPRPLRPSTPAQPNTAEDRATENFWKARRSLQIYPIKSDAPEEHIQNFMTTHLGLAREEFLDLNFVWTPLPDGRSGAKDVVNLVFDDQDQRDKVKRLSKNLARSKEPD